MRTTATFLQRSRHNVYYFRMVVPVALRPHINKTEIKRSLRTSDKKIALRISRLMSVYLEILFYKMNEENEEAAMMGFTLKNTVRQITGHEQCIELTIDPDNIEAELKALQKAGMDDPKTLLAHFNTAVSTLKESHTPQQNTVKTIPISMLVEDYCKDKIESRAWTPQTEKSMRESYELLLGFTPI